MIDLISNLENITPDMWLSNESEFRDKLLALPSWSQIPLINSNASHSLPDSRLVRFRGMIQDMHNPEFYFESFEVFNNVTNEVKVKSGKYRDTANIGENEKINYASNLKSAQRQTLVVVSMPGLNEWAKSLEDKENKLQHLDNHPNTSKRADFNSASSLKRSFEESNADGENGAMEVADDSARLNSKELKTTEKSEEKTPAVSREHILNFPLPDVASKSCIVKTYDDNDNLKLNEMVEVIGFLSVDPSLNGEFYTSDNNAFIEEPQPDMDVETITHNPPPSLVPRLHAVYVKKLDHCNPLVSAPVDQERVLKEAQVARDHLKKALKELLLGDDLAAEYLICHLISCVYLRQETITLGQFTLNLSNIPNEKYPHYTQQLYGIIKQFVTKSYYLPMTLENMNTLAFLPKKDYECNRLTSGILQLSKGTHFVVDETQMQQGRLDGNGVNNLAAIGNLIKTQKVEYDFKYYKMEFDSDITVLILSEGKSLLPCEVHVPLKPDESSLGIFNEIVEAATYYLKEEIMNIIRTYLTNIKTIDYTINEDLQFVQDDFIEMRNSSSNEEPVTADDLHRLLVLARLVSLSKGFNTLDKACWDITKEMERERQFRVKNRLSL